MPSALQCRRLLIPNTELLRQAVYGALIPLTKPYNWEDGGTDPEVVASAMFEMVVEFLGEDPCMPGQIVIYITSSPPARTLALDGSTHDGADYPALWEVLHSNFKNGDGTFTLPNCDETYLAQMGGSLAMGDTDGANTVSLTTGQMPAHTHTAAIHTHLPGLALAPGELAVALPQTPTQVSTTSAGSGQAHQNKPKTLHVKFAVTAW